MAYFGNVKEEELKLKVGEAFFNGFDRTVILGNVDFCIAAKTDGDAKQLPFDFDRESFLWAESKRGTVDLLDAFAQLVLTIGKARTFEKYLPPVFLGAFDADKIGFVPFNAVMEIFYQNDFNWNVTPSDHATKEFQFIKDLISKTIQQGSYIYHYAKDADELAKFIKANFKSNKQDVRCIPITRNNFVTIYLKWLEDVKPTIDVPWENARHHGILDADFYLADLLSEHNLTLKDKLNVVLRETHYELNRKLDDLGLFNASNADFTDKQAAHTKFWNHYSRPPKRDYWDYIIERRDLLIPQDVRERKGSFFTPQKWVEKAQEYLATVLGENWQDEYIVWDCCAGTGNLETGLVNKYNVWASTLDKSDVDVMLERINNGANLLPSHVFQFDFLNDSFDILPGGLKAIVQDPKKRRKLVIFINPPYAEHGNARQSSGTGRNKSKVATGTAVYAKSQKTIGTGARELFIQFLYRIYTEIPDCVIGNFSTLKILIAQNFERFRNVFLAKLQKLFIVPADTFDNVNGQFPIGFFVWNTAVREAFTTIDADIYDANGAFCGIKHIMRINHFAINWIKQFYDSKQLPLAFFRTDGSDVQHNKGVCLSLKLSPNDIEQHFYMQITAKNLLPFCVYFTTRKCIEHTWLNDRDQYLWPSDDWQNDTEFQSDCLAFTIFSRSNNIRSIDGVNHWIPFTEAEVEAQDNYASHFMLDYMAGRWQPQPEATQPAQMELLPTEQPSVTVKNTPIVFSPEAQAVFNTARDVWRYYHHQPNANPNAGFYDIRLYFQGINTKGDMNPDSKDETYTTLMAKFKLAYKALSAKIEPQIYAYGFLLK